MMQRAFFALEDTKTPFKFTVIQISLHIIGAITISQTLPAEWLVVGLSGLTSVTVTIQAVVAYAMLRNRVGSLAKHKIGSVSISFIAAGLLSGAAGIAVISLLGGVAEGSFVVDTILSSLLTMLITGFAMMGVYAIALRLLRVSEIDTVISGLRGILRR